MSDLDVLFNFGGLTNAITQVVQLSATDLTLTNDFDLLNVGRMDGESLFHADAIRNATDGEGLLDAAVLLSNNGTLEDLDTLTRAFLDAVVNLDGVRC